jgi:hypothetical protein
MLGAAAEAEARDFEFHGRQVEAGGATGITDTASDGAVELGAAFGRGGVVARSGLAGSEDASGFVADDSRRAGLAAVHSQEIFHGNR